MSVTADQMRHHLGTVDGYPIHSISPTAWRVFLDGSTSGTRCRILVQWLHDGRVRVRLRGRDVPRTLRGAHDVRCCAGVIADKVYELLEAADERGLTDRSLSDMHNQGLDRRGQRV